MKKKGTLPLIASSLAVMIVMTLIAIFAPVPITLAQQGSQWQTSDNVAPLALGGVNDGCSVALTTGAYAANPANSGAFAGPATVRAQASNTVYQVTTSAAASALTLTCDVIPPALRTTAGKGVSITGIQVLYGIQTTALSSVSASATPFSTITYPTVGAAAAGTVAAITGNAVFAPVLASAQLTTTTSGQCFNQTVTPASPIAVNSQTQRVTFEEVFNSTAGTATVYQICGVNVLYNNVVF
jgi:hypothetical protein